MLRLANKITYQYSKFTSNSPFFLHFATRHYKQPFSTIEKDQMKKILYKNLYPDENEVQKLMIEHNRSKIQVKQWFCRERIKLRESPNSPFDKSMFKPTSKSYTLREQKIIEDIFKENMYPETKVLMDVAKKIGKSFDGVVNYFHNKRKLYSAVYKEKVIIGQQINKTNRAVLFREFSKNKKPCKDEIERIARDIEVEVIKVKGWFYRQRLKDDKDGSINRKRVFNTLQRAVLCKEFSKNKHPCKDDIERIAEQIKVEVIMVKNWFYRKRLLENKKRKRLRQGNKNKQ